MSLRQRRKVTKLRQRKLFQWGLFAIGICAVLQLGMHSAVMKHRQQTFHFKNVGNYESLQELKGRSSRFPSVEARLKLYMSSWYLPPCTAEDQIVFSVDHEGEYLVHDVNGIEAAVLSRQPESSKRLFRLDHQTLKDCSKASIRNRFCDDAVRFYLPSLDRLQADGFLSPDSSPPPFILQFGDAEEWILPSSQNETTKLRYPGLPVLKKFRHSIETETIHRLTENSSDFSTGCRTMDDRSVEAVRGSSHPQAIITIVSNVHRHFGPLEAVSNVDMPWAQKLNKAVYRGGLTGRNHRVAHIANINSKQSSRQVCQEIPRCDFVLRHADSELVDAKLVEIKKGKDLDLRSIDGIQMFGETLSMREMLRYKAIVMLEGNDVSTGLKWALLSNSVVLMKRPTCTSWIMEELLEPYVHYVPIEAEESVDNKVQWILDNEREAQAIARRGKLWIADLLFHPDAQQETELILDQILRRYTTHFRLPA